MSASGREAGRAVSGRESLTGSRALVLSSIIRAKLGDTLQSLGRFDEARES